MTSTVVDDCVLSVSGVCLSYESGKNAPVRQVLDEVDLSIGRGEWVSIMGESGSGKTSLMNIAAGLLRPSEGSVFLDGVDITGLSNKELATLRHTKIGIIHQDYLLFPELTVYENVSLPLRLSKVKMSRSDCESWLIKLGISEYMDTPVSNLSGGQKQRVAIARALSYSPSIIFADEPTAALDSDTSKELTVLLRQLATETGVTVVLVTHSPVVAMAADGIYFIKNGKLTDKTIATTGHELASLWYDINAN